MTERRNYSNIYANAIIKDLQNSFVSEETISFSETKIERIYEFEDGAIVKYEWQSEDNPNSQEPFNHRFTLINTPSPNPSKLEIGIIKVVNYSTK